MVEACRRSLPIDSTQALRKRTRAGMGGCQGKPWNYGCECRVAQIIARENSAGGAQPVAPPYETGACAGVSKDLGASALSMSPELDPRALLLWEHFFTLLFEHKRRSEHRAPTPNAATRRLPPR